MKTFTRPARTIALSVTSFIFFALTTTAVIALVAAYAGRPVSSAGTPAAAVVKTGKKTMRSFGSEEELKAYMRKLAEERKRQERERAAKSGAADNMATAQPAAPATGLAASESKSKDESITNTQHAGVDEGGIVKLHGDHLVVLRRGRLFTVAIGDNSLKPISTVDAFGPDVNPNGTWYDEMLVSTDTVAVIVYIYQSGGT